VGRCWGRTRSKACSLCVTHTSYSRRSRISLIPSDTAGPSTSRWPFMPPTSSYQGSRSVLNRSHRIYKYNGMSTRPECYAERMEWTKSQAFPLLDGPVNTTKQASSCLVVQVEHPAQISASTSRPRDSLVQWGWIGLATFELTRILFTSADRSRGAQPSPSRRSFVEGRGHS